MINVSQTNLEAQDLDRLQKGSLSDLLEWDEFGLA